MSIYTQAELKGLANICAQKIINAEVGVNYFEQPCKHLVIDNVFDERLANFCIDHFPSLDDPTWEHANDADIEVKYSTTWKSEFDIANGIIDAVRILYSSLFLEAMGSKFSIKKIIPDPYFTGGGLNVTKRGGLLDVHVDGNYHDVTGLNRRLNVLVYLNRIWQPEWGGEFGIYDAVGETCLKKVALLFNRLVIFDSHDKSFHGLPAPLEFPEGETRKSILLYYYTKEARPDSQVSVTNPNSALWKKRNLLDKLGNKTRNYY